MVPFIISARQCIKFILFKLQKKKKDNHLSYACQINPPFASIIPLANYVRSFDCSGTITCHLRNIIVIAEKTVESYSVPGLSKNIASL